VQLTPGMVVRAKIRTAPARPVGTWTSWAVALPGADWEEHHEQAVWKEIDDCIPGTLAGHRQEPEPNQRPAPAAMRHLGNW
jgi:hypothetical protein